MSRKNLYTFISMKYYLAPDSALHSGLYSAPDSKIEKISILVPFQATIDPKIILHETPYTPSFLKKKGVLHHRCFQKHPPYTPFILVFTVDEVCYISNKYQPLNNLAKHHYFYTRDFISLLHFKQKFTISIAEFFRNIHRNNFLVFLTVDEVCYISNKYQPPYDLVKRQYFDRIDFISFFFLRKNWRCLSQTFYGTSTIYYFFTVFKSE